MLTKNYLSILNSLLIAGVIIYIVIGKSREERSAYILNQEVFNSFDGKKELERKLQALKKEHKAWLDSVSLLLDKRNDARLERIYQQNAANFDLQERELIEKYTADIWKQINQYVHDYGKQNHYDFIFGASGNGSLMFASDKVNVTKGFILYINNRYKKGE